MKTISAALAFAAALALSACETLPVDGPAARDIASRASAKAVQQSDHVAYKYALVDLTSSILGELSDSGFGSLYSSFGTGGPSPEIRIGVGDIVQVTLFESGAGGLFTPAEGSSRQGNYVTLPTQTVDRSGFISVPYADQVLVAGRTIGDVQKEIAFKLSNRALEPQAIVSIIQQRSNEASVVGEVQAPAKLAVSSSGDRVLDMIARAGGIKWPGFETFVTIQRNGRKATVFFNNLIANPKENIFVAPGDSIYVYRTQRLFLAFGATGVSGEFKFEAETVSLADAVARAGGLIDTRADPRQVFLYRMEDRRTLERMQVNLDNFPREQKSIPTIYRSNFRDPSSFFVAQKFPMNDRDSIYVSNADQVELNKFLGLVNDVSSTVSGVTSDAVTTRNGVRTLIRN